MGGAVASPFVALTSDRYESTEARIVFELSFLGRVFVFGRLDLAGQNSGLKLPGIKSLARQGPDQAPCGVCRSPAAPGRTYRWYRGAAFLR